MPLPPSRFPEALAGRYQVQRRLGAGAMGAVFLVHDQEVGGRPVAVKVTSLEGAMAEELRARFWREARALAGLEHPAVLRVYDIGEVEGLAYLVTEFLEGSSLERPIPGLDAVGAMLQVAEGLDVVHAAGLVHRDLKPANVFWTTDGRAVLLDFGLVLDPGGTTLTRTGRAVGTPATMAPEVLRGKAATPAADWYSWGATLYMAMERAPMRTEADLYALLQGREVALPDFREVERDPRARGLIEAALTFDPAARVRAVAAARAHAAGRTKRPRPPPVGEPPGAAPPPPVAPPSLGRGALVARATLALGLFGLGIWIGWPAPGRPGPAASPPVEAARVDPRAADVASVEQGLEEVLAWVPEATDPARWERVQARLPGLARLWALDIGGEAGDAGLSARLRLLDTRFASKGLPRPFLVEPSEMPAPPRGVLEQTLQAWLALPVWDREIPPEVLGVLEHLHRSGIRKVLLERDLEAIVEGEGDPAGLVPEVVPMRALAGSGERSILQLAMTERGPREVAARWIRPGSEELRRALRQAARVLPVLGAQEREGLVLVFRRVLGRDSVWFHGELAVWPVDALLPQLPDDGAGAGMRAMVLHQQDRIRRRMGIPWRDTSEAGISWGIAALETEPEDGGQAIGLWWRRLVLTDVLRALVGLGRGEEARGIFRRERNRLRLEADDSNLMDVAEALSVVWQDAGADAAPEAQWLLEHIGPQKGSRKERLERYLGWARRAPSGGEGGVGAAPD